MIKGCTVDMFDTVDDKPDECVLDTGDYVDCVYADIWLENLVDQTELIYQL